jgi:hypothetical protein
MKITHIEPVPWQAGSSACPQPSPLPIELPLSSCPPSCGSACGTASDRQLRPSSTPPPRAPTAAAAPAGTILDSNDQRSHSWRQAAGKHGLDLSKTDYLA